jgi:hypothetical protein
VSMKSGIAHVRGSNTAGIEAELCNEAGMVGEGGDSDGVGDELGNDVVGR